MGDARRSVCECPHCRFERLAISGHRPLTERHVPLWSLTRRGPAGACRVHGLANRVFETNAMGGGAFQIPSSEEIRRTAPLPIPCGRAHIQCRVAQLAGTQESDSPAVSVRQRLWPVQPYADRQEAATLPSKSVQADFASDMLSVARR
jgi:hypothetical protein